jgi:predicted nucleic acid-binding protein
MILADSSVWLDHFRHRNASLAALVEEQALVCHPFVVGELACGDLRPWQARVRELQLLPQAPLMRHDEVLALIERHRLMTSGIGWVDAHLLGSALLGGARLWTLDKPLARAAAKLSVLAHPSTG